MVSLPFLSLLLATIGGEARSLKNSIHGEQVAQDNVAQALRLQDLALLASSSSFATNVTLSSTIASTLSQSHIPTTVNSSTAATSSSPSTVTSAGTATPTASQAAMGIANSNSTVTGFSIYSPSNLPTGVLAPPSSCADAMMATIECNSTILLMGYNFSCTTTIVHDNQRSTDSTHFLTLPVSGQCVPFRAPPHSSPTGLTLYLIVLATQCRLLITEPILVCMPSSCPTQSTQIT